MWDEEVDVACIGAGIGALANAIATVDAGGRVLVADAARTRVGDGSQVTVRDRVHAKRGWLIHDALDAETDGYFSALTDGVAESTEPLCDPSVPVRVARNLSLDEADGRRVETFVGARLDDWAATCLFSRYGLMHTSTRHWPTTTMRTIDGDSVEVFSVGAIQASDGHGEGALRQWMSAQVRERGIVVRAASALQRIVFDRDAIVGVVLSTPEGPYAVRTRAGVTFAPRDQDGGSAGAAELACGDRLQVCMIGRTASRFGRVELLATEPVAPSRPACTASRRQFRDVMHESRQPSLEGWRCGEVHGYPTLGQ